MNKKKFYGDARFLHLDLFESVITIQEKIQNSPEERNRLESLYEETLVIAPMEGELVKAIYVGLSQGFFNFDAGFKDWIRVEDKPSEANYLKNTEIGSQVEVLITNVDEDNYFIRGSFVELYENIARKNLASLDDGTIVMGFIREITPAGYSVDIEFEGVVLPGFMPNTLAGINKLYKPESIVGRNFEVAIESYSRDEGTYIVSRRRYLQTLIPTAIKELQYGEIYVGNVTGTTEFGVFVEFNDCLTGMIHKTNIHPDWSNKLNQIQPGVPIEFYIKEIIKDKIILTQILRETLWDKIKIGNIISGKVKDLKPFGALIQLDDETNGLIHTSELEKFNQKLQSGQEVKVKVIAIDRSARKIFLTLP